MPATSPHRSAQQSFSDIPSFSRVVRRMLPRSPLSIEGSLQPTAGGGGDERNYRASFVPSSSGTVELAYNFPENPREFGLDAQGAYLKEQLDTIGRAITEPTREFTYRFSGPRSIVLERA